MLLACVVLPFPNDKLPATDKCMCLRFPRPVLFLPTSFFFVAVLAPYQFLQTAYSRQLALLRIDQNDSFTEGLQPAVFGFLVCCLCERARALPNPPSTATVTNSHNCTPFALNDHVAYQASWILTYTALHGDF